MKKLKFLKVSLALLIILCGLSFVEALNSNSCALKVSLVNQDPNPAVPNDYVDIVFQVSGIQDSYCEGAKFELISSYPFSLDSENGTRVLEGSTWTANSNNNWNIPYSLRIDKDTLSGDAEIEVHYAPGRGDTSAYSVARFNISIQDSRTNFDAVIQDVASPDISIAIANTGKYAANSVVVRIPDQDNFRVIGTDGQMVGNLDSGDYTIVSFSVASSRSQNLQNAQGKQNLKFDIYYTDNIGERRIVNMELPLALGSSSNSTSQGNGNFPNRRTTNTSSSFFTRFKWLIIIVVVLAVLIFFIRRHKIKAKLKKSNNSNSSKTPEWVKNVKDKEKVR